MPSTLQRSRILESENEILVAVAQGNPASEVLNQIVTALETVSGDVMGSILGLEAGSQRLRVLTAPNLPHSYNQAIDGIVIGDGVGSCGTAAYRGTPIVVEDILHHPFWSDFKDIASQHGLRACWSTPIISSNKEVMGTFACYYTEPKLPTDLEWELMSRLGHLAAIVMERERSRLHPKPEISLAQLVIEQSSQAMFIVSEGHSILTTNPKSQELFGYSEDEFQNRAIDELLSDESSSVIPSHLQALPEGHTVTIQPKLASKTGVIIHQEIRVTVLPDRQFLLVFHPPLGPNQMAVESETSKSQSPDKRTISRMANCIAEAMNQHLTSIVSHRDLLERTVSSYPSIESDCKTALRQIETAASKASACTKQLSAFSENYAFKRRPLNLARLLSQIMVDLQHYTCPEASIEIRLAAKASTVYADQEWLSKAIRSIARYADVSPDATQTFHLTARTKPRKNRSILSIRFQSKRLATFDKDKLFTPFVLPGEDTLEIGIGLASARNIITQMAGTLEVRQIPENTIQFDVSLPREANDRRDAAAAPTAKPLSPTPSEYVLVCEDNEAIRLAIEGLLKSNGYRTKVVKNGNEALDFASGHPTEIGVLVSDIRMPGIDGKELTLRLKQKIATLQVILISGHTGGIITNEWLEKQNIQFLAKPFSHKELIGAVSNAFSTYHSLK